MAQANAGDCVILPFLPVCIENKRRAIAQEPGNKPKREMMMTGKVFLVALGLLAASTAQGAELRILTTGAPKQVVQKVADAFAAANGHTVILVQDTAGGVRRRVEAGEVADVVVATPEVLDALAATAKVAPGTRRDFARTGVGIGIRDGAAKPDISTVDAVKQLIARTPSIALPDPKAGGTSAVYLDGLFVRLGVADVVKAKAKYQAGGYAAEIVSRGEAEVVFHQISEIRPVKGVTLVGPLPVEIQSITTYSASLSPAGVASDAAKGLMAALSGAAGRAAVEAAGMDIVP